MYCTKCGSKNDDDSMFCTKCGTNLQSGVDINIIETNKTVKKDIGIFQKLEKIYIKNKKKIFEIAVITIILIISIFLLNIRNNNKEENTNIDDDIYINESGEVQTMPTVPIQETVDVSISSIPSGANIH